MDSNHGESPVVVPTFNQQTVLSMPKPCERQEIIDFIVCEDGRYFTQAKRELHEGWRLMKEGLPETPTLSELLFKSLPKGAQIGIDPSLISQNSWDNLQKQLNSANQTLVPVRKNLVNIVWGEGRPKCPQKPIYKLGIEFTGKNSKEKLQGARKLMIESNVETLVVSELDEIAWLLNLRGYDFPTLSVFVSYVILTQESLQLFIDPIKLADDIRVYLATLGTKIFDYEDINTQLKSHVNLTQGNVWFTSTCNYALVKLVPSNRQLVKLGPIALMKAVKNPVEVEGMRSALLKDAATIAKFLKWVEEAVRNGEILTEHSAAAYLTELKRKNEHFLSISFTTISATGANAAIIHYMPTNDTDTILKKDDMYLIDSGAIYKDGTTDITRTIHLGTPTDYQRECYTRVLKGQIAIATSVHPNKIVGSRLDALARRPLWDIGLDYGHGTGHGIGHALNVHEGPSAIKDKHVPEDPGLRANMFFSNEPGYYEVDRFGIRLENIVRVVNVTLPPNFQNRGFIGFEDFTFLPYQLRLIKQAILTKNEVEYLNNYHKKCRDILGKYIKDKDATDSTYEWIIQETQALTFQE